MLVPYDVQGECVSSKFHLSHRLRKVRLVFQNFIIFLFIRILKRNLSFSLILNVLNRLLGHFPAADDSFVEI